MGVFRGNCFFSEYRKLHRNSNGAYVAQGKDEMSCVTAPTPGHTTLTSFSSAVLFTLLAFLFPTAPVYYAFFAGVSAFFHA